MLIKLMSEDSKKNLEELPWLQRDMLLLSKLPGIKVLKVIGRKIKVKEEMVELKTRMKMQILNGLNLTQRKKLQNSLVM